MWGKSLRGMDLPLRFQLWDNEESACLHIDREASAHGRAAWDRPVRTVAATPLRQGLALHLMEFCFDRPQDFSFEICDGQLSFSFFLEGRTSATLEQGGRCPAEVIQSPAFCTASFLPAVRGTWSSGSGLCRFMTLCVATGDFEEFWREFGAALPRELASLAQGRPPEPFFAGVPSTPVIQMAVRGLERCPVGAPGRRLFLECKAMELMILMVARLSERQAAALGRNIPLSAGDRERIHAARDILQECMEEPPSLQQLARRVGINEFKLKRGFRKIFGTTAYGFLRDARLALARQYLESGAMNVCEACMAVGYSNPGNFIGLFKRRYGATPGDLRQCALRQTQGDDAGARSAARA